MRADKAAFTRQWWALFLVLVFVFTLAYAQSPLYTSEESAQSRPDPLLQWYQRVQQVDHFYSRLPWGEGCYRLEQLAVLYDATHVVVPRKAGFGPGCMMLVAENASYGYYQIVTTL
jgi:hypothetical protein